ncbi:MAG: hypothetical protein WEB33_09930 [Bacteroidota bacterium]
MALSSEGVEYVVTVSKRYTKPSRADLFALACSKELGCCLLSEDNALRKAATREKIDVHGTLWILDELIRRDLLSTTNALSALEMMISKRSWFPRGEIDKRRTKWGKED